MTPKLRLVLIYITGFLMAVHFASVTYVNSSLLLRFVSNSGIGWLFMIGSFLSIILLAAVPFFLRRLGSMPVFIFFIIIEIIAVFGLGSLELGVLVILLFLIHVAADPALYLCLDVNLEEQIRKEGTTGVKRGILLTISNFAWLLSPLGLIFLVNQQSFSKVYFLSGLALIPLLFIILFFFKNIKKTDTKSTKILLALRSIKRGGDKVKIIGSQFILNFFYSWMIIYLPLLLNKEMGLGWGKIGLIFIFMLLPFVLLQLPTGLLADKKIGEKELLVFGFITMSIATFLIPFINSSVLWIWAIILFFTRIGASIVEASSESYFFKQVQEEDTGLISLFRIARPLAYLVAPLFAVPIIYFTSYSASFFALSLFTVFGLFLIPKIDTK